MISKSNPLVTKSQRVLLTHLVIFLIKGVYGEYCDPVCPAPCRPIVMQEDMAVAVVDWRHLWPDLPGDCIEAVTVLTNGEESCNVTLNITLY